MASAFHAIGVCSFRASPKLPICNNCKELERHEDLTGINEKLFGHLYLTHLGDSIAFLLFKNL